MGKRVISLLRSVLFACIVCHAGATPSWSADVLDLSPSPYRVLRPSNLREGPSKEHLVVGYAAEGAILTVTGKAQEHNWYRIERRDGTSAFISGKLVQPVGRVERETGETKGHSPPGVTTAVIPEKQPASDVGAAPEPAPEPALVQALQTVVQEDLDGLLEPNEVVEVGTQVPGILAEVTVERGDRVRRGQVVAHLKSGVEKAAVELARARVAFGKRKVERNEELHRKQLISVHEKDEMETELEISVLQLREVTERLKLRTIESPIDGIVVERFGAPGEYVGEEDPIVKIARIDPLNVEVVVPVDRFGTIKKGMHSEVRPEAPVGGVYRCRVVIVDQVMDAASGTFGVRLELPNPSHKLPAGLNCKVRFLKN